MSSEQQPGEPGVEQQHAEGEGEEFLSPEVFARRTGLSVHTVRTLVRQRKIAAARTSPGKGGRVLIPVSEIRRLHEEAQAWRKPIVSAEPPEPIEDDDSAEGG